MVHRCDCCGEPGHLTLDHLIPQALGGGAGSNLHELCWHCNNTKSRYEGLLVAQAVGNQARAVRVLVKELLANWRGYCADQGHRITEACHCANCEPVYLAGRAG